MNWKDTIKKDLRNRMGGRMSSYGNTPKTQEIRRVDGMQQSATTANVERKRNERNAQVLGQ